MGVTAAQVRVALNTSTGTQDVTTSDLGGLTPKAVILIATRVVTDGTAVDGASFYVGASDGTNEWTNGYEEQHAQATMNSYWNQDTTANRILTIYNGAASGTVEATIDFDSFITEGVRINITDAPASAFLLTVIFFAGSDLSVHVGTQDLGNTADAAIDVNTVGFEPDVVIGMITEDGTTQQGSISLGVAHNNRSGTVVQRGASFAQRDAFSSSAVVSVMRDDALLVKTISTGALDWTGAAGSFDSSGFTIQLGNARPPINSNVSWLALRLGASPVISAKAYTYSTPTATGSHTDSTPGFTPQFVMYLATRTAVANTIETDADAGTFGLLGVTSTVTYTNSNSTEDGAADSNAQSLSDNQLNLPTHTGASGHQATLTSLGSTGPVWNYSATDATARVWGALALGVNSGGTLYTQSASGGMTPSGALLKMASKALSGANTPAGSLTKLTSKTFTGAATPTGALSKLTAKIFDGALTPAGALARMAGKIAAGTLTSSGSLSSSRLYILSADGSIEPTGTLLRQTLKALAGNLSPTGALSKLAAKAFSGFLSIVGDLIRQTNKTFSGGLTPTGALQTASVVLKSIGGTLTSAGTMTRQTVKSLAGALSPSGSLSKITAKTFAGTVTAAGDLTRQTAKALAGSVAAAGTLLKQAQKLLAGSITSAGTITRIVQKSVGGALTLAGTLTRLFISGGGVVFQAGARIIRASRSVISALGRKDVSVNRDDIQSDAHRGDK